MDRKTFPFVSEPSLKGKGSREQYLLQSRVRSHAKSRASKRAHNSPIRRTTDIASPKAGAALLRQSVSPSYQMQVSISRLYEIHQPGLLRLVSAQEYVEQSRFPIVSTYIEGRYHGNSAVRFPQLFEYRTLHEFSSSEMRTSTMPSYSLSGSCVCLETVQ